MPRLRDSNHFGSGAVGAVQPDPLSNRILIRPIGFRKLLVHNRHAARSGAVVIRECATALHFDIQGAEVTGVHRGAEHDRFFAALRKLVPFGHYAEAV